MGVERSTGKNNACHRTAVWSPAVRYHRQGRGRSRVREALCYSPQEAGKIQLPELVDLMKTSVSRELAPYDEDWFHIRCASLARRLYVRQGTGVGAFSKVYGAKKRRGTLPGHFCRSSRGVIRNCLKQLMKVGVVEHMPEAAKKKGGRRITKQGQQDCDRIAKEIFDDKQN